MTFFPLDSQSSWLVTLGTDFHTITQHSDDTPQLTSLLVQRTTARFWEYTGSAALRQALRPSSGPGRTNGSRSVLRRRLLRDIPCESGGDVEKVSAVIIGKP